MGLGFILSLSVVVNIMIITETVFCIDSSFACTLSLGQGSGTFDDAVDEA